MKNAIFILSDPQGGEESLARLFNAFSFAVDCKEQGDDLAIVFSGTGTRWPAELSKLDHPARPLHDALREEIKGASCGCAEVFGATDSLEKAEVCLLTDQALAGTKGVAGYRHYIEKGYNLTVF